MGTKPMKRYTVNMVRRWCNLETADFEVEAENVEDARRKAVALAMEGEGDWDTDAGTQFGYDCLRARKVTKLSV